MCIYYKEENKLEYTKREHIFPAGLGGMEKLPLGWVSDQANELFSPMESQLMHNSLISLDRLLFGPGKRGTLSPKKASQSNVVVGQEHDGQIVLSYTSMGTPHSISHFYRSEQHLRFNDDLEKGVDGFIQFVEALKKYQGQYKLIVDNIIPEAHILVGYHKEKYYVAAHSSDITPEHVQKEITFAISQFQIGNVSKSENQVRQHFKMLESADIAKVYAKTAINVSAKLFGLNYVMSNAFDDIKQWIIGEACKEDYFRLPQIQTGTLLNLPDKCHWCIILPSQNKLAAIVCFYNTYYRNFEISNFIPNEFLHANGMICDWKNKKEYTLTDWFSQVAYDTDS